nr:hypothetical protein [Gemmatimonadaceae bacterium]
MSVRAIVVVIATLRAVATAGAQSPDARALLLRGAYEDAIAATERTPAGATSWVRVRALTSLGRPDEAIARAKGFDQQ